eukprot:TRINITY_DN94084_c0_g1_i1.p1 TRINITY_DN94084_c0_g1~~TRINITY_DN94084_c0_g1_i1.p1  ORF type:complete len:236 (-),score=36.85 TRINITY_DN94084_c0_g1_i1:10-717(-)
MFGEGEMDKMAHDAEDLEAKLENFLRHPRPLGMFGCGCSLRFGTFCILSCTLIRNVVMLGTAFRYIVLASDPSLSAENGSTQLFNTCYALFSLPFVFFGYYALWVKSDTYLRPFLYYLYVSCILDVCAVLVPIAQEGMCGLVPLALRKNAAAVACGFARIFVLIYLVQMVAFLSYFMYTVWSTCEDMKKGSKNDFPGLLKQRDLAKAPVGPQFALFGGKNNWRLSYEQADAYGTA